MRCLDDLKDEADVLNSKFNIQHSLFVLYGPNESALESERISQNILKCLAMTAVAEKGGFKDQLDYSRDSKLYTVVS